VASQRWRQVAQATIAADGTGTAVIAPVGAGYYRTTFWSVTTSQQGASSSTATIFRDSTGPLDVIEGTYSGDQDTSDTVIELEPSEQLLCVWTGALPGAAAVFRVEGRVSLDGVF
jgi:hypothetical protein